MGEGGGSEMMDPYIFIYILFFDGERRHARRCFSVFSFTSGL